MVVYFTDLSNIKKGKKEKTSVVLSVSFGVGLWKDVTTLHIKYKSTVYNHYWPNGPLLKRKTLPESSAGDRDLK
jgi:hypothetical protein